jgi:hypothetical protein
MCLASPKMKQPEETAEAKIERENETQKELKVASDNKAEQLERAVKRKRGGRGGVSLLTGSRGGLGYYNETV